MNDYIELGPDDVIREGDQFRPGWTPFTMPEPGTKVSDYPNIKFLRLRSEFIRDAAIELLRDAYGDNEMAFAIEDETYTTIKGMLVKKLREAIGISVEDLRKGGEE